MRDAVERQQGVDGHRAGLRLRAPVGRRGPVRRAASRRPGPEDPWYLTALDARTGKRVWSVFTGTGLGYNNNYAPITLGPDGTAYVGVLGGLVAVRDRTLSPRRR